METFTIAIEETVVEEFKVKANNVGEALKIAEYKYRNKEFILCPGEVQFRQMAVLNSSKEVTEWVEF